MSDPIALRVIYAIRDRLQLIDGAAPYTFDLSDSVSLGKQAIDEGQVPCAIVHAPTEVITSTDGEASGKGYSNKVTQAIEVEAYCDADSDDWLVQASLLLADLKRALRCDTGLVESGQNIAAFSITGSEKLPPQDSLNYAGVRVSLSAYHTEKHGDPTTK